MQGDGLVLARRGDLQEFKVVGTGQLVVNDARRLQATVPGTEGMLAVALIGKPDPALQNIDHLKIEAMLVQPRGV